MSAEPGTFMQNLLLSSRKFEEEKQYWLNHLSGELQFSMFPSEKTRGTWGEQVFEEMQIAFPQPVSEQIFRISGNTEAGAFILLLAGVTYVLHRYLDNDDISVGIPASSGAANSSQLRAIRINFGDEYSFKELVLQLSTLVGTAKKYNHLSLEKILELLGHEGTDLPRVATVVRMDNMQENLQETGPLADMVFSLQMSKVGLALRMNYNAALYSPETIEQIVDHVMRVLSMCTAHPDEGLHHIKMLSLKEDQIIQHLNDTEIRFPEARSIIQMIQSWSAQQPDIPAVICGDNILTYQSLDCKSDQLAKYLLAQGVRSGAVVGILLTRSEDMLLAMLGVLKAGAAYMPMDPAYANNRLQFMLEDSQAEILLTKPDLIGSLIYTGQIIDISHMEEWDDQHISLPVVSSEQLAYLIYTSGSTGRPKGVMIEHLALRNFVEGVSRSIPFEAGKRILALTTFSFDIFVLETLGALANGLTLIMAVEEDQLSPSRIAHLIVTHNIELIQITPSRLRMLQIGLTVDSPVWSVIQTLMIGGEALPYALYEETAGMTSARIYNMYGPTETTIWSSIKELSPTTTISIGHPIANTRIYILDKRYRHMPIGATGELCIAGDGVARGYWNRPELTAERFVKDPFHEGAYMYKTGDLARLNANGDLEYLGRSDFQVKIRGYRIELGEIENRLLQYPAISAAAVTVRSDQDGQSLLCAYYTVTESQSINQEQLRSFLLTELPEYMLPSRYTMLDHMPYTANGKLDRKALPDSLLLQGEGTDITLPRNALEQLLAELWSDLLQLKEIDVHARFFEIGGHSLNVIKLEADMERQSIPLTADEVMRYETIASLAEVLRNKGYEADEHNSEKEILLEEQDMPETDGAMEQFTEEVGATSEADHLILHHSHRPIVIIAGIEAFNDVFYKNCFYNSLFPVLNLYSIGVLPVMINDRMHYRFDEHQGILRLEYQAVLSDDQLIERMGLTYETKTYSEDIRKEIIEAVNLNCPVIIRVDCYYESLRKDMYLRTHWPHSLLIYGYDLQRQVFHVIEHDHRDNLTYQPMEMPMNDIVQAYEGFVRLFMEEEEVPTFYAFSACETVSHTRNNIMLEELRDMFIDHVRVTPGEINQELSHLLSFIQKTYQFNEEDSPVMAYAELVLQSIVDIVNAKKVETYRMQRLYEHHTDLVSAAQAIQDHWSELRNVLAKAVYRENMTHNQWRKFTSKLEAIHELEKHNLINCSGLEISHD
ncbi:amino acid adenylation domain-containing protein [Paenibacillus xylanexedens]|uniref:amino acid adenylation domain-containing protein n=1 Tax=Paenibacillus xylanexedens TaxID=528191 RepID=UPI003B0130EC